MAGRKIAATNLQATTIQILNTIRANASLEYQNLVPEVVKATDVPKVGEVLLGYPAMANQFISALLNRIALVSVKSATFNNPYRELKKGYLEYGETVEEVFVEIAKAREFSVEKAEARELKRTLPDVRSAFHIMNYYVQYPVTIQEEDLRRAFLSLDGVQDMIARIVDSVYRAAEYDEFLLFKYMLIKAYNNHTMYRQTIANTTTDAAKAFRAMSNKLTFITTDYNAEGVHVNTPREDQYIFMDADYNAAFDVDVLSAAFHMEKADFMGRLMLIDSFTTFDNERFENVIEGSDQLAAVTPAELTAMADVKAILVDREFFQVYDNYMKFTEKFVAAGDYWNYFLNVRKTVSYSPFSNIVAFTTAAASAITSYALNVASISVDSDNNTVIAFDTPDNRQIHFVQTEAATTAGIAIKPYGLVICPAKNLATSDPITSFTLTAEVEGAAAPLSATVTLAQLSTASEVTLQ